MKMVMIRDLRTGDWFYIDLRGDKWRLTPTGDPNVPLVIKLEERKEVPNNDV